MLELHPQEAPESNVNPEANSFLEWALVVV